MIIYGRNVIREALNAGVRLNRAYIVDSPNLSREMGRLETALQDGGAVIEKIPEEKLDAVCHSRDHQGVAARLKSYRYSDSREVLDHLDRPPFLIILDGVQDPHNVGAIVRTAYGAGADLLVLSAKGGCPVTPAVLKTSAGYAFRMEISVEGDLPETIRRLKGRGLKVYGAGPQGMSCFDADLTGPLTLIFGNEGVGLSRAVREECDQVVTVPMAREMDSLNVAASAAIIAFRVAETRRSTGT